MANVLDRFKLAETALEKLLPRLAHLTDPTELLEKQLQTTRLEFGN
jgi:hypothetical protein